ncbi:ABC transporter permease [Roseobacter litoralis]|uniref:Sugar ABC transporter permease protein n=1 Tax=Roseobacter litoralis (strain ATCC 49566 / DSM 6996 / JCM 21268 / NBRC 15278 / OCh 149) TaxID=391595 RepID=F7ZCD3_ROSLO|nr:ABC transporter permease [Roseobacter litoralis]AEI95706.1 sugar ABC transporter permease protein [Roseobacter litoralis Och 149]
MTPTRTSDLAIILRQRAPLLTVIAIFLLFYIFYNANHPRGFSTAVYIQNSNEVFALVMVAMAQTVPVLLGGLDLSVGAVMTLVNTLASHLLSGSPLQIAFGFVICLATGALCGFVNGCVVVYGRIQPIIATLATGAIFMGLALFLRPSPGGDVDGDLAWAMTNDLFEIAATYGLFDDGKAAWFVPISWIPVPAILMVAVAVFVWLPFARSVTGRTVYAIGSGESAAYMSGLNIDRAKIAAFTLGGFFAGIGGIYLTLQTSSGNADIPQAGAYTLNSIAAVVIGGTSLLGGVGTAIGSIFGALVLRTISFNFRIFEIDPLLQPLFEGVVLLGAVSIGALGVIRIKNKLELFR